MFLPLCYDFMEFKVYVIDRFVYKVICLYCKLIFKNDFFEPYTLVVLWLEAIPIVFTLVWGLHWQYSNQTDGWLSDWHSDAGSAGRKLEAVSLIELESENINS